MNRTRNKRSDKRKNGGQQGRVNVQRPPPIRSMRFTQIVQRPNAKEWVTYRAMMTVNNAAFVGANTTIPLYLCTGSGFFGIQALYGGSGTNLSAMYNSSRLLAVKARINCSSLEAFPTRVSTVLTSTTPVNNSLNSQVTQLPLLCNMSTVNASADLGPLTGNGRTQKGELNLVASNSRNLGVRNVKGISDAYTNYWDSTTDNFVVAVSGLSLVLLVAGTSNLVSGVSFDVEADCLIEFFTLNANRTS